MRDDYLHCPNCGCDVFRAYRSESGFGICVECTDCGSEITEDYDNE